MIKAHGFQILTGFLLFKYELLRTNIGARERHIFTIGGKKIYKLTENEYIERNASHKNIQNRISRYATLSKIESDKKHQLCKPCSNCFVLSLDKTF